MKRLNANTVVQNPVYQALIVFVFAVFFVGVDRLGHAVEIWESPPNNPWIIMTASVLFFALLNSVLSLKADHPGKYWSRSIMVYLGLAAGSILIATVTSGLSMEEAGTFRWLFVVLSIGYLVFMSIVRLMRRIVEIAIKQDERLRGGE